MNPIAVLASTSKIISSETIKEISDRLTQVHKPIRINYQKRFGLEDISLSQETVATPSDMRPSQRFYCVKCKKTVTEKVAKFCWDHKNRFYGKVYCYDCQKAFPGVQK
jgi:hypothetical protein